MKKFRLALVATAALSVGLSSFASAASFTIPLPNFKKLGTTAKNLQYAAGFGGQQSSTTNSPSQPTDATLPTAPSAGPNQTVSEIVPDKRTEKALNLVAEHLGLDRSQISLLSPPVFGGYGAPVRLHLLLDGKNEANCVVDLPTRTSFGWHADPVCKKPGSLD